VNGISFIFHTTTSRYAHLDRQECYKVRELVVGTEIDAECAPMFRIRFESGEEIDAFDDELQPFGLPPAADSKVAP
jgi:hypothetical protein